MDHPASPEPESALPPLDPYEAIPYIGKPRPLAHPDAMATRAHLFGIASPAVETARVLEIGCADGANITAVAASLPDSVCVGIDRSPKQIATGKETVTAAGLGNITLDAFDFCDLPDSAAGDPFDYIIVHGVYSWISPEAQRTLVDRIRTHLSPNGVAFVSYNCYPGWNLRQIVREFLLFHTAGIDDPKERVQRCRTALPGLIQSVPQNLQAYAALMVEEQQLINQVGDDYIAHEHLEIDNRPCYFHEFAARLAASGLQFFCESELSSMQANRYPASLSQLARQTGADDAEADPIRAEQYLDFASLRMFRQSLICHAEMPVKRNLDPERVRSLSATAFGVYQQEQRGIDNQPESFQSDKGIAMTTAHPLAKAAMRVLAENWPNRLPFDEIVKQAHTMLASSSSQAISTDELEQASNAVAEVLLAGATAEIVELHSSPARYTTSISDRPVASPLARAQVGNSASVSTLRHRPLMLNTLGQAIITLLDGEHDHRQLADAVLKLVEDGKFVLQENGLTATDPDDLERLAKQQVTALLDDFARSSLLIA